MAYTSLAVGLDPDSAVTTRDYLHPDPRVATRVVTIEWDSLTIHVGGHSDARIVAALDRLIVAAATLRAAAAARLAPMSEAEIDAAHEQAVAELDRVMAGSPEPVDVPTALGF